MPAWYRVGFADRLETLRSGIDSRENVSSVLISGGTAKYCSHGCTIILCSFISSEY